MMTQDVSCTPWTFEYGFHPTECNIPLTCFQVPSTHCVTGVGNPLEAIHRSILIQDYVIHDAARARLEPSLTCIHKTQSLI